MLANLPQVAAAGAQVEQNLAGIEGAEIVLKLAPLQRRRVGDDPERLFGLAASASRCDHAVDWEIEPVRSSRLLAAAWLTGTGIASGVVGVAAYSLLRNMLALWLGISVAAACAIGAAYVIGRGRTSSVSHKASPRLRLDPTPQRGDTWGLARDFVIATSQGVVIAILVFVAVAAPASAIYYGTELSNVIVFDTWRHPSLVNGPRAQYIVVARFLQLILLIIVSLVPALSTSNSIAKSSARWWIAGCTPSSDSTRAWAPWRMSTRSMADGSRSSTGRGSQPAPASLASACTIALR